MGELKRNMKMVLKKKKVCVCVFNKHMTDLRVLK